MRGPRAYAVSRHGCRLLAASAGRRWRHEARRIDVAVAQTKETGYDILELSLHDTGNLDVVTTRAPFEAAGRQIATSRDPVLDADISSDAPAVVARALARHAHAFATNALEANRVYA